MRKLALLLAVMAAAMMLASGIAFAKNIQGDGKDNRLVGTSNNDTIAGSGGDDGIFGKGGQDRVYGDSGSDNVSGGAGPDDVFGGKGADNAFGNGGDDYINVSDNRGGDVVDCGPGFDLVIYDGINFGPPAVAELGSGTDTFSTNCEDPKLIIINPEVGTGSEDNLPISTMSEAEVEQAIEDGTLIEVE